MQKDRKKQVIIYIVFCIVLALILAVYAFVLYVKQNYGSFGLFWETADFRLSNSKFYDNLDSARQEFKNSVKEADLNINAGQDYIENIEISQPDEDDRDGTSWFNVDKIVISVSMKEDIHKVYIQDRCQLIIRANITAFLMRTDMKRMAWLLIIFITETTSFLSIIIRSFRSMTAHMSTSLGQVSWL